MSGEMQGSSPFGSDLIDADYQKLNARWISRELANEAGLRRVDSYTGREMFARKSGDCSGVIVPYMLPGDGAIVEYRLRVDNPALERRADGSHRETGKYIQPPGRPNRVYFPVGTTLVALADASLLVIITEGEFKAISLWRLANWQTATPRFLPLSVAGVYNWRGTIGKTEGENGDRRDVKGVVPDIERIVWKGRRAIIAFDADAEKNPKVRAARSRLMAALIERGAMVGLLEWPSEEGKGVDDRLANVGPDKVLADIAGVEFGGWQTRLLRSETGKLMTCYENAALFLQNSPEWAGTLGYNEFTGGHFILKPPPAPISTSVGSEIEDHFDTESVRWLERHGVMVKPDLVRRVVDGIARRNSFHPVREYLESLPPWDGIPRIGSWLIDYCGVESGDANPNEYARAVGEKFLISAVARILEPGCKVDHMLVLEGPQGIGKSTAVRILAGEWFTDQLGEMGSKDAAMQVRGAWIIELSELGALGRADTAREKAFISQQMERYRLPYGHRLVHVPRQCVFIGTTNADTWLKDETGGRRFWPVPCHRVDLTALEADRDQLWAEAVARYRDGVKWWLEDPELIQAAIEEQRGRYVEDAWQEKVGAYAIEEAARPTSDCPDGRNSISIPEILARLGVDTAKQDQSATNRVARCLKVACGSGSIQARVERGSGVIARCSSHEAVFQYVFQLVFQFKSMALQVCSSVPVFSTCAHGRYWLFGFSLISMTEDLAALLARRVLGWEVAPDRFLLGQRRWLPRWRFQPTENLEDAFRLLDAAAAQRYTMGCEAGRLFWVRVRIGGKNGEARSHSKSRAITLAVARALQISAED